MSLLGIMEKRSETLANPGNILLGFFGGRATDSGLMVSEANALTYTAVYACVQVIAEAIATLPMNLYKRRSDGGQDIVRDLPYAQLFSGAANEETGAAAFKATAMGWVLTWGNGYGEIERNNAGEPIGIHQLAPNRVLPRRQSQMNNWRIEYYLTRTAMTSPYLLEQVVTDPDPIDRDDMLHLAGLGFDGIIGYSPVAMAREAVGLGLATQAYGARFFGNSGVPSGILTTPKKIGDPTKLRKSWNDAVGGGRQRGTAVLEDDVKFQAIGIPPEDSQFLQTRGFQKKEIASIYRVPPHMIADLERSTNNNIEHQGKEFVTYCLMSWLVRMEQECNRKLLTPSQIKAGFFFAFDVDELLRGDTATRYQAYTQGSQWGWLSPNDIRLRERMNSMGPKGDIYRSPMNMVPLDQLLNPPTPAPGAGAGDGAAKDDDAVAGEGDEAGPDSDAAAAGGADGEDPSGDTGIGAGGGGRSVNFKDLRKALRGVLVEAATRGLRIETRAVLRAAKTPGSFAPTVKEFYRTHADVLAGILLGPASAFAGVAGMQFPAVRDKARRVAQGHGVRAITELATFTTAGAAPDVQELAAEWLRQRPAELADALLCEMGI